MSTVLTRDAIKTIDDRKIEPVEVPEWGGMLYVRGLSGRDRDDYELTMLVQKGRKSEVNLRNLRAKLVSKCAVDSEDPATAKRVFEDKDVEWLGTKSAAALQRVFTVAQRLSGLSNEEVEELAEGLGEEESDGSGSDSPDTSDSPSQ